MDARGDQELDIRLWLRELSQDRLAATVQLVATSLRPLYEIFQKDESPDYSPFHNVMVAPIILGPLTDDEARQFIATGLAGTPFEVADFVDLLKGAIMPGALKEACRARYEQLYQERFGH